MFSDWKTDLAPNTFPMSENFIGTVTSIRRLFEVKVTTQTLLNINGRFFPLLAIA